MSKKYIISLMVNLPQKAPDHISAFYVLGQSSVPDGPTVSSIEYKRDAGLDIGVKHDAAYVVKFEDLAVERVFPAAWVTMVEMFDEVSAKKAAADNARAGIPD